MRGCGAWGKFNDYRANSFILTAARHGQKPSRSFPGKDEIW